MSSIPANPMSQDPASLADITRQRIKAALREHTLPLDDIERLAIETAVARHHGCMTRAARDLGIGRTTIYGLISTGRIRTVKVGRRTLVSVKSLIALLEPAEETRTEGSSQEGVGGIGTALPPIVNRKPS